MPFYILPALTKNYAFSQLFDEVIINISEMITLVPKTVKSGINALFHLFTIPV